VELIAAVVGAIIGVGGLAAGSLIKKSGDSREVMTKLSLGIEHIGQELQALREDMKEDRHEIFGRLGNIEQRISSLEAVRKR
jgi:hypothetical protein